MTYSAAASFDADVVDSGHYHITVAQTGLDTANLSVRTWPIGSDYSQPPQSDHSFSLTNCRELGLRMTCSAQVAWFISDGVEIDVSAAYVSPSIKVQVSGIGGFTTLAPVSQADHDQMLTFLKAANFPAG